MQKMSEAFRNISEVATELDVPKHVLRFWEGKFVQLKPMKRGGGRRYYRPEDVELLKGIRHLLYSDGYTIRGVQKLLRENGVDYVKSYAEGGEAQDGAKPAKALGQEKGKVVSLKDKREEVSSEQPVAKAAEVKGGDTQREVLIMALSELEVCKKILHNQ